MRTLVTRPRIMTCLLAISAILCSARASAQPRESFSQLVERWEALNDRGENTTCEQIARRMMQLAQSGRANQANALANANYYLGVSLLHLERAEESLPPLEKSLELFERAGEGVAMDIGYSLHFIGAAYNELEKYAEAAKAYDRAVRVRIQAHGEKDQRVFESAKSLAHVYLELEQYQDAQSLFEATREFDRQQLGRNTAEVGDGYWNIALTHEYREDYAAAIENFRQALEIYKVAYGAEHSEVAGTLWRIADAKANAEDYAAAVESYAASVPLYEKLLGKAHEDLVELFNDYGNACFDLGRYDDARARYQRAIEIAKANHGPEHLDVAFGYWQLADCDEAQNRWTEALALYERALKLHQNVLGEEHSDIAKILGQIGWMHFHLMNLKSGEESHSRAIAMQERISGPDSVEVAEKLQSLAWLYDAQSRSEEAESLCRRAIDIYEEAHGSSHRDVAAAVSDLAWIYDSQARYAEAEPLYTRAMEIYENTIGTEHTDVAELQNKFAWLHYNTGRYAAAEAAARTAIGIYEASEDIANWEIAYPMMALAAIYDDVRQWDKAEQLYHDALEKLRSAHGNEHADIATIRTNLGWLYYRQDRFAEATPLFEESLRICAKIYGEDGPDAAHNLHNLGLVAMKQGRLREAEEYMKRVRQIFEESLSAEHPLAAWAMHDLANIYRQQNRRDEAQPLIDRAIAIRDAAGVNPSLRYASYLLRARLSWELDRRGEALADLRIAMDLAEQMRGQSAGAEHERATFFTEFSEAFEQMVAWQVELKNPAEALAAMERGRARSLLDELNLSGADLGVGYSAAQREQKQKREAELKQQIATLEKQLRTLQRASDDSEQSEARQELMDNLASARRALYEHYRDERSSSPVYRNLLTVGRGLPRLSQIQREVVGSGGLLLIYMFGEENGYVLCVTRDSARLVALESDASIAGTLAIAPGPLTATQLQKALLNEDQSGVVQQIASPAKAKAATDKLAAFWRLIIPEEERAQILAGEIERLIVVPDGPLALLPIETLVVNQEAKTEYLLDVGTAVIYAPSATVLYNLLTRSQSDGKGDEKALFTVGDPRYTPAPAATSEDDLGGTRAGSATSRFFAAAGDLPPLPYSGRESKWVAEVFGEQGLESVRLDRAEATEENVRREIANRRFVHLACHGFTDKSPGNFFGALAFTPGDAAELNPADDGFLTLAEIYDLDLSGCDLAILSACQTNYGEQQQGEGVWSLSRGFLIAGSQRVVASNWLVDDEAAANLVAVFCRKVAEGEKANGGADYADALLEAKRWIRRQSKWDSPYYWGTFVLVGPQ